MSDISIDVYPNSKIAEVSPLIYSGFIEHLGRCIYGGILPAKPTDFPYSSKNPCPQGQFSPTPPHLISEHGFRSDVIECIRDELNIPMMRWPGGNYVSTYHWEDGIGPIERRKKRPELAWGGEEPNTFGTDECVTLHCIEPWGHASDPRLGLFNGMCNTVQSSRYNSSAAIGVVW